MQDRVRAQASTRASSEKPKPLRRNACCFGMCVLCIKYTLQAVIEFKKNLRVRFGKYGGLKLEYFWVVKSKKAKSFIRG